MTAIEVPSLQTMSSITSHLPVSRIRKRFFKDMMKIVGRRDSAIIKINADSSNGRGGSPGESPEYPQLCLNVIQ
jgi:hypothetical protein